MKQEDVRLEFCFLVCELVVDGALDLTCFLQELDIELKDRR